MSQFNYKKAWIELSVPAWETLPKEMRALVSVMAEAALGLHQDANLDVPWPDDGGLLRAKFDAWRSESLARAARILWSFGHWAPALARQPTLDEQGTLQHAKAAKALQDTGAYWKFGNYVDQVLRSRLGLVRRARKGSWPNGVTFEVHEGGLRACFSSPEPNAIWTWRELGWATEDLYARVRAVPEPEWFATNRTPARFEQMFEEHVEKLRAAAGHDVTFAVFTQLDRYMEPRT